MPVRSSSGPTAGSWLAALIFTEPWGVSTVTLALLVSAESVQEACNRDIKWYFRTFRTFTFIPCSFLYATWIKTPYKAMLCISIKVKSVITHFVRGKEWCEETFSRAKYLCEIYHIIEVADKVTDLYVEEERNLVMHETCAPQWHLAHAAPQPDGPCSLSQEKCKVR